MQAVHEEGTPSYSQGWGPAVNWTDRAKVDQVGAQSCVPVDCYTDVLVIDEFNRDEPGAHQLKYYALDVGGIRVGWRGAKEEEREVLVLSSSCTSAPRSSPTSVGRCSNRRPAPTSSVTCTPGRSRSSPRLQRRVPSGGLLRCRLS